MATTPQPALPEQKPKRRWLQFSVTTLLVVIAGVAAWLGVVRSQAERQRKAVAAIEAVGGQVFYVDYRNTAPKPWPQRWLPKDWTEKVEAVRLDYTKFSDSDLRHLRGIPELKVLIIGHSPLTDAGLVHLHGLNRLEVLHISDTQVTDAGLTHIQGLTQLKMLDLARTQITDAGLSQLMEMDDLIDLNLSGTHVTDIGLSQLQRLTALQRLPLEETAVTKAGVLEFQSALPNCTIIH